MKKRVTLGSTAVILCLMLAVAGTCYGGPMFGESSMVRQYCGACHKPDPAGKLEVIEDTRKTPEEWKVVMIRMLKLNGAQLDDADFLPVVKEVSDALCLAPSEMAGVAYLNSDENSQYREIPKNKLEERIYTSCVRCHTYGKIASHRMTEAQWDEIRAMHLGYYPTTVPQMRELDWMAESKALMKELAKLYPFDTPEWKAWVKDRKDPDLSGDWPTAGYQPGLGYYHGVYSITPDTVKGKGEYLIEKSVKYMNGMALTFHGTGTLYAGYHLRYKLVPTPLTGRIEGVFDLDAKEMTFTGKWWTEIQDANTYGNESFAKAGVASKVIAAFPAALKTNSKEAQTLTIVGVDFPEGLTAKDITFSDGSVKTSELVSADASTVVCNVSVGGEGVRLVNVTVGKSTYENPVTVYDKVDGIKILPHLGRARVSSGAAYPPQGVQFVARAVHFGADEKAGTVDDIMLEPVDVQWKLAEEVTRDGDDDIKYLNTSIANGLYTPITTYGPILERKQHREGVGLIAVEASVELDGRSLSDKALLAVTDPDFITHIK